MGLFSKLLKDRDNDTQKQEALEAQASSLQPELYEEDAFNAVETHIGKYFGEFTNVFHEIVSPDIHVDICFIPPTEECNYFTLVTMGMGAHRMNTPAELAEYKLERAELAICLPPDWQVGEEDERWYWPIRLLKQLARLPGECDTWLGWGHTVDNQKPYADNTELCGAILLGPLNVADGAQVCTLSDGDEVNFYQVLPLYAAEMAYKQGSGAEALFEKMEHLPFVVQPDRPDCCDGERAPKNFYLKAGQIKPLLTNWEGPEGCIATDRIVVDGCKVGFCYREKPDGEYPDSGWRFTAGDEDEAYMNDSGHSGVYALNTLCNYDPEILPLLDAAYGTAFLRDENGVFQREDYTPREEE